MIKPLVKDRAVRIVDPSGLGRDMKNWARGIGLSARGRGLNRSRRPGQRIVHGFSMGAERPEKQCEQEQMTDSKHKVIVSGYAFRFKKAIGLAGRKVVIQQIVADGALLSHDRSKAKFVKRSPSSKMNAIGNPLP